jgi:hypothetical protein
MSVARRADRSGAETERLRALRATQLAVTAAEVGEMYMRSAGERLAMIEDLQAAAGERLALIEDLRRRLRR